MLHPKRRSCEVEGKKMNASFDSILGVLGLSQLLLYQGLLNTSILRWLSPRYFFAVSSKRKRSDWISHSSLRNTTIYLRLRAYAP